MSRGKRYDGEPKLNIKKVIASILVLAVIIMIIILIIKFFKKGKPKAEIKNVTNSYLAVYTNERWGVINSKGEYVIKPEYENMIVIPDQSRAIFICQENVDLESQTYKSIAIDDKSNILFENYDGVEVIQNIDKNGSVFYDEKTLKVLKNGKYGLINFNGKELLECNYDSIEPIKYLKNSYITSKDNKKGLVDNSGTIIIENEYADIKALTDKYEDGYIVKNNSSKYGVINYNKKQILECKYTEIKNISGSEMYVVKEGEELEVVDSKGIIKLKDNFDDVISIDNNNIIIKKSDKYGIISSTGETKINTQYEFLSYLYDGNYIAKKDNKYGIIDLEENTKVEFNYKDIFYMRDEGFIEAEKEDGNTALMNTTFEIKCEGTVSEINTNHSFIKVRINGEYKYYNFKLEEKSIKDFYPANTLFLSKKDGKYGFVNKNDIVIVDYQYEDAKEQNDYGYAAVKKDGKWGAIDSTGKVIVEPKYYLEQNTVISFIGKWHLAPDLNANYYTDVEE